MHFQRTFWEKRKPRGMQAPQACLPLEPRQGRSPDTCPPDRVPPFPNSSLDLALGHGRSLGRAAGDAGIERENTAAVARGRRRPAYAALRQHTLHLLPWEALALYANYRQP